MKTCEWITRLNADAVALWTGEEGPAALDALEAAASAADLTEVVEEGNCRIYRTPDDRLVNLWIEGIQSERIEDGGFGFDDQVGWWQG